MRSGYGLKNVPVLSGLLSEELKNILQVIPLWKIQFAPEASSKSHQFLEKSAPITVVLDPTQTMIYSLQNCISIVDNILPLSTNLRALVMTVYILYHAGT